MSVAYTPTFKGAPGVVIKRDEGELLDFCSTELGFLQSFGRYNDQPLVLEPYQIAFLGCKDRYRSVEKSRQTGFSFVFALEGLARAVLRQNYTGIFISYNQEDSKEKIKYVKQLHDELPNAFQKKYAANRATEVSFISNGSAARVSRILSHPSRAPRGKNGDIWMDELAHYQDARTVFAGSTALVMRSKGQLTCCSTPLGQRGIFYEVARPTRKRDGNFKYANYWRQSVPWWLCSFFCDGNDYQEKCETRTRAIAVAPGMPTEERVLAFGSQDIKDQFDMLAFDDFVQEFECGYMDERYSFFSYDLLLPCMSDSLRLADDFFLVPRPRGRLVAGFDVGRREDLGELALFDETFEAGERRLDCVLLKTYEKVPFDEQEKDLTRLLTTLPISRLSIDENGIGMHLTENLQRQFGSVVCPESIQTNFKELIANDFKILLQKSAVRLPKNPTRVSQKLLSQLHSIKKNVTQHGKVQFIAERTKKGEHGDQAWAIMLACRKERGPAQEELPELGIRIIGEE